MVGIFKGIPTGWGEPCFDKLEATLAHAMMSIPATKGFEIGSGFAGTELRGSVHNDPFTRRADGSLGTTTNRSGGIQVGMIKSVERPKREIPKFVPSFLDERSMIGV